MNREELTQKIEGACLTWEQDTQAALSRALGGVTFGLASTTVDRWEAIRRAIEQQNDELRKLRAQPKRLDVATVELANALGVAVTGWDELVKKVLSVRTRTERLEQASKAEQRDVDANELARAIHAADPRPQVWEGATWTRLLGRVAELAKGYVAPRSEQLAECEHELRNAMGIPFSDWSWNALLAILRERLASSELDVGTEYLARIRTALGVGPRSTWEDVIARIERWRKRYEQLARLWFGLPDDTPAVPSMGNLIRLLEVRNTGQQQRQRAEDAAELRELLGASAQGMRWDELLWRVRDLALLSKAIEAVAHPRILTSMATPRADAAIERGDLARTVERSPLVDKAAP